MLSFAVCTPVSLGSGLGVPAIETWMVILSHKRPSDDIEYANKSREAQSYLSGYFKSDSISINIKLGNCFTGSPVARNCRQELAKE